MSENEFYQIEGWPEEFVKDVFAYLDFLRYSGATNMFGASPFIQHEFDLDRKDASKFTQKWMTTYGERVEAGEIDEKIV